ncbi:uncharacterized protein LOC144180178 [Haemaphysalis longicornis]
MCHHPLCHHQLCHHGLWHHRLWHNLLCHHWLCNHLLCHAVMKQISTGCFIQLHREPCSHSRKCGGNSLGFNCISNVICSTSPPPSFEGLGTGLKAPLLSKKKQTALGIPDDIDSTCGQVNEAGDVHLGHGVYIGHSTWVSLMSTPADSTFCKRLAVALWGPDVLAKRSLTGSASNKAVSKGNKTTFKALSPLKLAGMSSAFWTYLEEQNCPPRSASSGTSF